MRNLKFLDQKLDLFYDSLFTQYFKVLLIISKVKTRENSFEKFNSKYSHAPKWRKIGDIEFTSGDLKLFAEFTKCVWYERIANFGDSSKNENF